MAYPKLERFVITRLFSRSAFYASYAATERETGKAVHLKLLDRSLLSYVDAVDRLLNINRVMRIWDNPRLRTHYDYGRDRNHIYLVSEPIDLEMFFPLKQANCVFSMYAFIDLFMNLAQVLRGTHLHGLVHGLLTPDSIYVSADGEIKIDDFGFYIFAPHVRECPHRKFVAPEVLKPTPDIDGRADIYTLGMMLFQAIRGGIPILEHYAMTQQEQNTLMEIADGLLSGCLSKNPDARFISLQDFTVELQNIKNLLLGPSDVSVISEAEDNKSLQFAETTNVMHLKGL